MAENYSHGIARFEAFLAYWRHLQEKQGGIPRRATLDPVSIREMLPFVFLIERLTPDNLMVRLSGTALDDISPMPVTGSNYLELCPVDVRRVIAEAATAVCQHPCGHRFKREATFNNGKSHEITSVALPMSSEEGENRYMVGITSAKTDLLPSSLDSGAYSEIKILQSEFLDIGFGVPEVDPVP